jgi:superfamily I DNA/RNA helicase
MSKASLLSAIDDWLSEKLAKGSTTAQDDADCMKVFATHGDTLGQALAYMDHLFSQSGTIQLITGHKAKGLEWRTVYHLDPWLIREDEQDLNLKYVIETRAKDELYLIDSRSIR